jgi:anti-anti-sigma factor
LWIARSLGNRHSVSRGPEGTTATVGFALPRSRRPSFQLTRHDQGGRTTLRLAGNLDQRTAHGLVNAVRALISGAPPRRLVLDLSGMTFWDSGGIAALLTAQEHVNATPGVSMTLAGLTRDFRRRLDSLTVVPLSYENPADQ